MARAHWFAATAAVALAAPAAAQVYTPIPVTGYTDDVIADAGGTASATTTAAVDFGFEPADNSVFFAQGYNNGSLSVGIPASGTLKTSANRTYQLGPIAGNNSLRINSNNPVGTLTLVTPARDAALSLLLVAGDALTQGNVGFPSEVIVNWSDGQSSTFPYTVYDWWNNGPPGGPPAVAIDGLNRVDRSTGVSNSVDLNTHPTPTFAIYYYDLYLGGDVNYQAGALIDSLAFTWPGSPTGAYDLTLNVMALSGSVSVPEPSALLLTLSVVVGIGAFRRRRRQAETG